MNIPQMRFKEELDQEGPRVPRPSYMDKVPPWRGPGSWGTSSLDNPPRNFAFNPSWSMKPVKGDFTYSATGRAPLGNDFHDPQSSVRGFGIDYPEKTPVEKYYDDSVSFPG